MQERPSFLSVNLNGYDVKNTAQGAVKLTAGQLEQFQANRTLCYEVNRDSYAAGNPKLRGR